jgi:hypothetical protein
MLAIEVLQSTQDSKTQPAFRKCLTAQQTLGAHSSAFPGAVQVTGLRSGGRQHDRAFKFEVLRQDKRRISTSVASLSNPGAIMAGKCMKNNRARAGLAPEAIH